MGQGVGPKAAEIVQVGSTQGLWGTLQDCHLLSSWLKTLIGCIFCQDKVGVRGMISMLYQLLARHQMREWACGLYQQGLAPGLHRE